MFRQCFLLTLTGDFLTFFRVFSIIRNQFGEFLAILEPAELDAVLVAEVEVGLLTAGPVLAKQFLEPEPEVVLLQPPRRFLPPAPSTSSLDALQSLAETASAARRLFAQPVLALCPWEFRLWDVP